MLNKAQLTNTQGVKRSKNSLIAFKQWEINTPNLSSEVNQIIVIQFDLYNSLSNVIW